MRLIFDRWAQGTAVGIALLGGAISAGAAPLVLRLDANTGVLNTTPAPAANGDPVGTWTDQSTAGNNATVPVSSTNPQYSTNYSVTGNKAVTFTASSNRLTTPTPVISGTTDFLILARFYVVGDALEHVIATTFGQFNSQGFEFMEHQDKLKFYAGLTGFTASNYLGGISTAGIDLTASNGTFLDVAATRVGNFYTIYADLTGDGDFLDGGETFSGTIGTASASLSATKPLMIGNIDYGGAPIAINSLEIWVPEPASAVVFGAVALAGCVLRRRVR